MSIASNTQTQYSQQYVQHGIPGVYSWTTYESAPDKGKTQAAIAANYQNAAENEYNNAIGGLQSLLASLSGDNANSTVSQATSSLMDVYGSLGGTQDTLRGYANELGALHSTIGQISDNVNPVFAALTGIGGNLSGISSQLNGNYDAVDRILQTLGGIGDNLSPEQLLLGSGYINFLVDGVLYSRMGKRQVQFGNYILGLAPDDGLAFRPAGG